MLLYCIGPEAENVLESANAMEEDRKKYSTILTKFDYFFQVRKNTISEWANFNCHCQHEGETAEQLVIAVLLNLAENCAYGDLKDELICNHLVVGIINNILSERLQMDSGLTLAKAMTAVRQREAVRSQQSILQNSTAADQLDSVKSARPQKPTGKSNKNLNSNKPELRPVVDM